MGKKKTQEPIVKTVKSGLAPDFFRTMYTGKDFMEALIEQVKNEFDWGATRLNITSSQNMLRIFGNSVGMSPENIDALNSVGVSTAFKVANSSGQFGTGSKYMLYLSQGLQVRTTHANSSEVAFFEINPHTFQQVCEGKLQQTYTLHPKNDETWPYPYDSGTEMTYSFGENDTNLSGSVLRKKLSHRLPLFLHESILCDGEKLPVKKLRGGVFRYIEDNPVLGHIMMELYEPVTKSRSEGIFIGQAKIAEVSIDAMMKACSSSLSHFPEIFHRKSVCGTILVENFKPYFNEDRSTMREQIDGSSELLSLLYLIKGMQSEIYDTLGIDEINNQNAETQIRKVFEKLLVKDSPKGDPGNSGKKSEKSEKPIKLVSHNLTYPYHAVVGDDMVVCDLVFTEQCIGKLTMDDVTVDIRKAGTSEFILDNNQLILQPDQLGKCRVSITYGFEGVEYSDSFTYTVVSDRTPQIYPKEKNSIISRKTKFHVLNVNPDDVKDCWIDDQHFESGDITVGFDKERMILTVESPYEGEFHLYLEVEGLGGLLQSTLYVTSQPKTVLKIGQYKFELAFGTHGADSPSFKLFPLGTKDDDVVHKLYVNTSSPFIETILKMPKHRFNDLFFATLIKYYVEFEAKLEFQGSDLYDPDLQARYNIRTEAVLLELL